MFCAINHGQCLERPICDRDENAIIKKSIVKVKRCKRPSELDDQGIQCTKAPLRTYSSKDINLSAIMRAGGGWSIAETVLRYLQF